MADPPPAAPNQSPLLRLSQALQVNILANVERIEDVCRAFETCTAIRHLRVDPGLSTEFLQNKSEDEMVAVWTRVMNRNGPAKRDVQFNLLTSAAVLPGHLRAFRPGHALLEAIRLDCTWFIDRLSAEVPLTMTVGDAAVCFTHPLFSLINGRA